MNKDTCFFEVMEQANPFAHRDEKGKIMVFKDYSEVYLDCIEHMYQESLRGYLDVCLFLEHYSGMEHLQATQFLENFYKAGVFGKDLPASNVGVCLIEWRNYTFLRFFLRRFMDGMHRILETTFNEGMFKLALQRFCIKNNIDMTQV